MQVLVFADISDPWSFIGVTRLERASATLTIKRAEDVDVGFRSVQLWPYPTNVGRSLLDTWVERRGTDRAEEEILAVENAAARSGLDLNLHEAVVADTFDAHRLLAWAGQTDPVSQHELIKQLWRAYFIEGADIGDHLVLGSRAAIAGMDLDTAERILADGDYADEVRTQTRAAAEMDVTDLPVAIFDAEWRLDGIQSQDQYFQALDQLWAEQRDT